MYSTNGAMVSGILHHRHVHMTDADMSIAHVRERNRFPFHQPNMPIASAHCFGRATQI